MSLLGESPLPSPLPPIPPAPPIMPPSGNVNLSKTEPNVVDELKIDYDLQLENLIFLHKRLYDSYNDAVFKVFQSVTLIKQVGPTCGMASLATALSSPNASVEKIMDTAKSKGWSNFGEMYNCDWMAQLAIAMGAEARTITGGLLNHIQCIADCLADSGFILVPYDKDNNHSPTLRKGHSAHWCLVSGLVVLQVPQAADKCEISPCACSPVCPDLSCGDEGKKFSLAGCSTPVSVLISEERMKIVEREVSEVEEDGKEEFVRVYVCAYQGLSRNLYLWDLLDLAESNSNLLEEGPKREGTVQLPEGGISAGLAGKAVLLYPPRNPSS